MLWSVIFKFHTLVTDFRWEDWNTWFYKIDTFIVPQNKIAGLDEPLESLLPLKTNIKKRIPYWQSSQTQIFFPHHPLLLHIPHLSIFCKWCSITLPLLRITLCKLHQHHTKRHFVLSKAHGQIIVLLFGDVKDIKQPRFEHRPFCLDLEGRDSSPQGSVLPNFPLLLFMEYVLSHYTVFYIFSLVIETSMKIFGDFRMIYIRVLFLHTPIPVTCSALLQTR